MFSENTGHRARPHRQISDKTFFFGTRCKRYTMAKRTKTISAADAERVRSAISACADALGRVGGRKASEHAPEAGAPHTPSSGVRQRGWDARNAKLDAAAKSATDNPVTADERIWSWLLRPIGQIKDGDGITPPPDWKPEVQH